MISIDTILQNPTLLIGLGAVVAIFGGLAIMDKLENRKNYKHKVEYGSARWGQKKDIEPFINPKFEENVILSKTEQLSMESRPKNPKYARNKNVLVIGGSGSGKTRFVLKPNLLQMHSSYAVTDPKGYLCIGQ